MICFVALFVFAVLGIFSARYRKLAAEAFDCVFRKVTLRKCDSGLDTRLKSSVSGSFFKLHPSIGKFTFKHFTVLSWIFTILTILSIFFVAQGGYYYYLYGNCNGPNDDGFCIFDPSGTHSGVTDVVEGECQDVELLNSYLTLEGVDVDSFLKLTDGEPNEVIFLGCYACDFTRKGYKDIEKLAERDDVSFTWVHFPVKDSHNNTPIVNCLHLQNRELVIPFNDIMFETDKALLDDEATIRNALTSVGADADAVFSCAETEEARRYAEDQFKAAEATGIYGTPTVFVNGEAVVGPKPYRVYKRLLE